MQSKIGFIGLGAMGKTMAANIVNAGFELTVFDLREEPCKALAALGACVAGSPREVAEKSGIVEIAVVDDAQAEQVVIGEHGVIHGALPRSIVAIHSTILPATARKIAARCRADGIEAIDAPMSGGQKGAEVEKCAGGLFNLLLCRSRFSCVDCLPPFNPLPSAHPEVYPLLSRPVVERYGRRSWRLLLKYDPESIRLLPAKDPS